MKNLRFLFLLAALLLKPSAFFLQAQDSFIGGHFWISFSDKEESPYSVDQPQLFLSQKSIERRTKQGIPITINDLPVNSIYIDSLRVDAEVSIFYSSRWFNGVLVYTEKDLSLQRIISLPFVLSAEAVKPKPEKVPVLEEIEEEPEYIRTLQQNTQSSQSVFIFDVPENNPAASAWEMTYSSYELGISGPGIEQVNATSLISEGFLGQGKLIAVLDAGFLATDQILAFDHLWNAGQIMGWYDFVEPSQNIFNSSFHGTAVLSVMAAKRPGELFGTATGASYYLIRTEDATSEFRIEEYNWLAGAELADSLGADIINSSLGYTRFDDPAQNYVYGQLDGHTTVVARAANFAFERGMVVVNSAGNYAQQNWKYIGSPADSFGALSIGALTIEGQRASFSSFGPSADGRVKPDIMAHGRLVPVANTSNGISLASGTSFSSPLIAGLAAALWQKHDHASAQQIKKAIIESSDRYLMPDSAFGHGIPDFLWASKLLQYDFQPQKQLVIYPNPVNVYSYIRFYSENEQEVKIELFDLRGQQLFNSEKQMAFKGYNRMQTFKDIHHLQNGIYFIRLTAQNGSISVAKFIKAW